MGGEICVLLPGINEKSEKSEKFLKKLKKNLINRAILINVVINYEGQLFYAQLRNTRLKKLSDY